MPKPEIDIASPRLQQKAPTADVDLPRALADVDAAPQPLRSAAAAPSTNVPMSKTRSASNETKGPDKGLADRGYRAKPGERTQTRAQYKTEQGALRWERNVDEAVDRMFSADPADAIKVPRVRGRQQPRIGDKRVPDRPARKLDLQDIPLQPGETARQGLARVRTVFGKTLADYPYLESLWNDARARVLRTRSLTADNYGDLYDLTRDAFWRRVRGNTPEAAQARALLRQAGFELPTASTRAPQMANVDPALRRTEHSVSLDHIQEKGQGLGWQKALDADNLRMEPAMPNTHRENVQMRHSELRPDAPSPAGVRQFPERRIKRESGAPAARATPDSAVADEALIDAVLAGKLREFLDEDDLVDAALRGQLHEVLHGAAGVQQSNLARGAAAPARGRN